MVIGSLAHYFRLIFNFLIQNQAACRNGYDSMPVLCVHHYQCLFNLLIYMSNPLICNIYYARLNDLSFNNTLRRQVFNPYALANCTIHQGFAFHTNIKMAG